MGRWRLEGRELGVSAAGGTCGELVAAVRLLRQNRRHGVQRRRHIASHLQTRSARQSRTQLQW